MSSRPKRNILTVNYKEYSSDSEGLRMSESDASGGEARGGPGNTSASVHVESSEVELMYKNLTEEEIAEMEKQEEERAERLEQEKARQERIARLFALKLKNQETEYGLKAAAMELSSKDSKLKQSKSVSGDERRLGVKSRDTREKPLTIGSIRKAANISKQVDRELQSLGLYNSESDSDTSGESTVQVVRKIKTKPSSKKGKQKSTKVPTKTFPVKSNLADSDSDTDINIIWPHEALGPKYFNYNMNKIKYKDLDSRLLIAGELNIIRSGKISAKESACRLKILSDIVFNMGNFEWGDILRLHAAMLTEIENGDMQWDSDFSLLDRQILRPRPIMRFENKSKKSRSVVTEVSNNNGTSSIGNNSNEVIYCNRYQKGLCEYTDTKHQGKYFGRNVVLEHICAKCWEHKQVKSHHPKSSSECQFSSE